MEVIEAEISLSCCSEDYGSLVRKHNIGDEH